MAIKNIWKVSTCLIFYALIGLWIYDTISHLKGSLKRAPATLEVQSLQEQYERDNIDYFHRSLPRGSMVHVKWGQAQGNMGITYPCSEGLCIEINQRFNPMWKQARVTLLHEECHVKEWTELNNDGPRWHGCMRDLMTQGAFDELL